MGYCIVTDDLNRWLDDQERERQIDELRDYLVNELLSGRDASYQTTYEERGVDYAEYLDELLTSCQDEIGELLPKIVRGEEMGKLSNELEAIMRQVAVEMVYEVLP